MTNDDNEIDLNKESERESDKPRTQAEMRAKTERYNGFPTPPRKRRYWRGGGREADLNFAIHGDD